MTNSFSRRDIIRRTQGLVLASPFISLSACDGAQAGKPTVLRGATMGTSYSVVLPRQSAEFDVAQLKRGISDVLEAVNAQMSTYRADSELSRFNAAAAAAPFAVSANTRHVVAQALEVSRLTTGAFDPTLGPLVDLWGFGPPGPRQGLPTQRQIKATFRRVGFANVSAGKTPTTLTKNASSIRIDLSGIAKGFGVDEVARLLETAGVGYYLVEIGGEVRTRGYSPRGDVWRVGIERPESALPRRVISLGGKSLATSGNYRNFFENAGARYSHIIDPRNGRPVEHGLASVTVAADTAMLADAWSTALMVMGSKDGFELARANAIGAFFITKTDQGFRETATDAFLPYLIG